MPLFTVTNLRFVIGVDVILDGASLSMEAGQRVGLVGRNGSGKTTLMRIITGALRADSGEVMLQKGARAGYLAQDPDLRPGRTLLEEARAAFAHLDALKAELDALFEEMSRPENAKGDGLDRLLKRQADLERRIEAAGGYAVEHRVEAVLHGLGFTDEQFSVDVAGLSGGQRARLALAKLLLDAPDLVLLDEPTNHLDVAGCEWLEQFLTETYAGAVLLVSHDRYLLDKVVDRIEELEDGRLIEYPGNYSKFREIRRERKLTQARAYENQQSRFRKEEEFIRRFKAGQRAKQARGRESRLEREKSGTTVDRPMEVGAMRLELPKAPRSGDLVVSVRGASKRYEASEPGGEPKVLFRALDVKIQRGERWGIIGPNGAGKTSLVRAILGDLDIDEGAVQIGSNVVIGYYSQTDEGVRDERQVYRFLQDAIRKENPDGALSEQQARDLAGAFLFSGDEQNKAMLELSGGERSRARLASLLASAKNLLVLDEPTNHLDIPSAERLEEALSGAGRGGYEGTLILISHDRALVDNTCDHLLVLDGKGGAEVFHGSYTEWHERRDRLEAERQERSRQASQAPSQPRQQTAQTAVAKPKQDSVSTGLTWMPLERLEKEIARLERSVAETDALLASEEVYRDAARCRKMLAERDKLAEELERHETEWLRRAEDA